MLYVYSLSIKIEKLDHKDLTINDREKKFTINSREYFVYFLKFINYTNIHNFIELFFQKPSLKTIS